jgi:glycosyltransferase involved in cell wall biosynthesis
VDVKHISQGDRATVLRLITRLNIGGPGRQAILLTRGIGPDFPTVLAAGIPGEREGELDYEGLEVRRLPLVRPIQPPTDARAFRSVRRLLSRTGAKLLHTHMAKAGTVGRLAALRVTPRPALVHTFHGHVLKGYFGTAQQRVFLEVERWLARWTDALLAVSPEIRDELLEIGIGRPSQFHVIPLGLDLDPFLTIDGSGGTLRKQLGLGPGVPLAGVVGRLVPIKDHATLLRSMRELPELHLAVLGDGELRWELENLAEQLGIGSRVHFVGWWRAMADALADLDVVILTSRNEGTPVALIEALAASRPVVATDVGGVRHVVKHGVTGLLCAPGDILGISQAVRRVLVRPEAARALAAEGRRRVATQFGHHRLIDDHRSLYAELLAGRRGVC